MMRTDNLQQTEVITRSRQTYERLVDAVISTVFEHGYVGATMTRIAQKAGLTRGAIQHHFGDKRVDLITAACEHVLTERQNAYRHHADLEVARRLPVSREGMKAAYKDPKTWFLIEVWIASKGDGELAERVGEILARVNDPVDLELMARFSGDGAPDFRTLKYYFRCLTRGLAIEYSRRSDDELFDQVVDLAIDALEDHARPNSALPQV